MVKTTSQLVLFFCRGFPFPCRGRWSVDASPPYFLQRPCAWPVLFAPAMVKSPWKIAGSRSWSNLPGLVMTGPKKKLGMEAMGLIEIDGLPFWISWWFFSSRTVKEPDGTLIDWVDQFKWSINSTINMLRKNTFTIQSSIVVDAIQKNTSRNHFTLWEFVA